LKTYRLSNSRKENNVLTYNKFHPVILAEVLLPGLIAILVVELGLLLAGRTLGELHGRVVITNA